MTLLILFLYMSYAARQSSATARRWSSAAAAQRCSARRQAARPASQRVRIRDPVHVCCDMDGVWLCILQSFRQPGIDCHVQSRLLMSSVTTADCCCTSPVQAAPSGRRATHPWWSEPVSLGLGRIAAGGLEAHASRPWSRSSPCARTMFVMPCCFADEGWPLAKSGQPKCQDDR